MPAKMNINSIEYQAEVFTPNEENWLKIENRIIALENEAFPTYPYSQEDLHTAFTNTENTVVLLKETGSDQLVGYVYSVMVDTWYPERISERNETVVLDNIVLDKSCRGQHLAETMTNLFEDELRRKKFKYFEVNANIPNGYAAKIERAYKDRIVEGPIRKPLGEDAQFGPRNGYKIKL